MATTSTNIKINIVEPGSSIPVDPSTTTGTTDISVPDTGLFTNGIGSTGATIIVSAVLVLTIVAIIVALYKKHQRQGKVTKLVRMIDHTKTVFRSKKRITANLTVLALVVSLGTLATLLITTNKNNTNAIENTEANESSETAEEGNEESTSSLTLDIDSEELTIEVGDEPVFAVLPVEVSVAEATPAGYTLTTYTDNTDLVSTTDSSNIIPMITVDEDELVALTDDTYGLSLAEPASQTGKTFTALSTDADNPTTLKTIDDYTPTPAEDKTTIYYGFYITPDTPKGIYEGSVINYKAEPNYITNLSFNGNGNDGGVDMEGMTIIAGDTITLPENTYTKEGYNFTGWNTVAEPTEQDPGEAYEDQAEYTAVEGETKDATLYAQWEEATLYMQDVDTWGSKLEIGDEIIAVDNRDNKEYYVARLADGNIWMTQNLDFDIVNGGADLNSTNTDVPESWTDGGNLTNTYATDDTTWSNSSTIPESYDPGNLYWNGNMVYDQVTCEANGGTWYDVQGGNCVGDDTTSSTGNSHYHLGNYYNWTAAVAMSNSSSYTQDNTDVNRSICPAGWMLPKSGTTDSLTGSGSFIYLKNQANLSAGPSGNIHTAPNWFVYGGGWSGSARIMGVGKDANYRSSVIHSRSDQAYALSYAANGRLNPQAQGARYTGNSVRCVAR